MKTNLSPPIHYLLHLADNTLVLGHRLSEWCGHGPVLEQDIAMTNIALDLVGQSRMYYQYAAEIEGKGRTEDDLAYLRDVPQFRNFLLVEQPNGDWGQTIVRQFLFDAWHHVLLSRLINSSDERLAAIAEKSLKEVTYHLRYSSEWVVRLGDGTEESHRRMANAIGMLWPFTGELFEDNNSDSELANHGIAPLPSSLKADWSDTVITLLKRATLDVPTSSWAQIGGKTGQRHSEHLGYILAELQWMQRAYPGMEW